MTQQPTRPRKVSLVYPRPDETPEAAIERHKQAHGEHEGPWPVYVIVVDASHVKHG